MEEYFLFYQENIRLLHPVLLASEMHQRLVTIHPFVDGNGRTARLVMNVLLLQQGYTLANISSERKNRTRYYEALEKSNVGGDATYFHLFIAKSVKRSLLNYLETISQNGSEDGKGAYFYQRVLALRDKMQSIQA
jgi:Fic family protein